MNLKKHIPNSLTLLNLFCGCLAVVFLFTGQREFIPYLVAASLLADFLDGLVARALKVSSPIGKELDSLADMVSFGVLPGMLMVHLVAQSDFFGGGYFMLDPSIHFSSVWTSVVLFFPLIVTLFSALRLAKFNVSTNQSKEFMGLATPAATIFVLGIFMINESSNNSFAFFDSFIVLSLISLVLAILLVSDIPMFSFKLGGFDLKQNKYQILLLLFSVILLAFFKFAAIPLIIVVYVLLNLIRLVLKKLA